MSTDVEAVEGVAVDTPSGNGNGNEPDTASGGDTATQASRRARARGIAAQEAAWGLVGHWGRQGWQTIAGISEHGVWREHPPSPADLRGYIRSAAWVPGDVPILELAGKFYGYVVAIPVSMAMYAATWLMQRPGRALLTAVFVTVIWFIR